jgi:hypothetical protein
VGNDRSGLFDLRLRYKPLQRCKAAPAIVNATLLLPVKPATDIAECSPASSALAVNQVLVTHTPVHITDYSFEAFSDACKQKENKKAIRNE